MIENVRIILREPLCSLWSKKTERNHAGTRRRIYHRGHGETQRTALTVGSFA